MTQDEWNASTDPQAMLAYLQTSGRVSERKLRLFAVACCRRIWHLLTDERSRKAVEVAEVYADGKLSDDELQRAYSLASEAYSTRCGEIEFVGDFGGTDSQKDAASAVAAACENTTDAIYAASDVSDAIFASANGRQNAQIEISAQAALIRDIFANPFRSSPSISPSLLTPDLLALAQSLYDDRATDRFPELADALEAAGCTDAEILGHLRSLGPHAGRGCWALDAILGKN